MDIIERLKKPVSTLLSTMLLATGLHAQILKPVKWNFSAVPVEGSEYDIVLNASIDEGWSVYSQYLESDEGPIPTAVTFQQGDHFERIGKAEEDPENRKEAFDNIFEMNVTKYHVSMTIRQRIRIKDFSKPIEGYVSYMTCDDTRCLPPEEVEFSVVPTKPIAATIDENTKTPDRTDTANRKTLAATAQAPSDTETASKPPTPSIEDRLYGLSAISSDNSDECGTTTANANSDKTLIGIFLLGMLGGILALLTPCVFPLIPLTVSFFTKTSENKQKSWRNATLYGVFILSVYILLSVPFHLLESVNPDILNQISTNLWLNIAFFIIFMLFAFSFFGYYEITIPSALTNKISGAEGVGGIVGIFFMALTLSLVSFSCTGPILGSLLAGALTSNGGAWQLTAGMSGFGLALALPFTVFALFPSWLNRLPRSGGWLNTVKVVLGFVELALAFKFLSNADLVMHWGILRYEVFIVLWVIIGVGLMLYLFGVIRFPHDDKSNKLSLSRIGAGTTTLVLVVYLAFGLTYNSETKGFTSLKLLSGLAPPSGYSWIYPNECPNGIRCFKDLQEGLTYAREQKKPVMLDFTGYACVNCRKMEEHVWPDSRISGYLNDKYVLISLYVDDKKELPKAEKVEVERVGGGKRTLRNYGHKWSHFQAKYFGTNSQPYYVLLSPDGTRLLSQPVGYTPDADEYSAFLQCGIQALGKLQKKTPRQPIKTTQSIIQ